MVVPYTYTPWVSDFTYSSILMNEAWALGHTQQVNGRNARLHGFSMEYAIRHVANFASEH